VKNIVLLYSETHFDPKNLELHISSSAGEIASSVFRVLDSNKDFCVKYFDAGDFMEWNKVKDVYLLVGIARNFALGVNFFKPKHSILLSVNEHPLARLKLIEKYHNTGFDLSSASNADGFWEGWQGFRKSRGIIVFGSESNVSFLRKLYIKRKIVQSRFIVPGLNNATHLQKKHYELNVLVLMSSVGFRKGIDLVFDSMSQMKASANNISFHIMGLAPNREWESYLRFKASNFENVTCYGWVERDSFEFIEISKKMDIAIFPSREEGMLGALQDSLKLGIYCLYSDKCGYPNFPPASRLEISNPTNLLDPVIYFSNLDLGRRRELFDEQIAGMNRYLYNIPSIEDSIYTLISYFESGKQENFKNLIGSFYRELIEIFGKVSWKYLNLYIHYLTNLSFRNSINYHKSIIKLRLGKKNIRFLKRSLRL
jgi:hypothetical protein